MGLKLSARIMVTVTLGGLRAKFSHFYVVCEFLSSSWVVGRPLVDKTELYGL